ncbi:MAG: transposase [Phycisphaerae bacterium]|nr:transposase [Phycisphaerae bacterium]
MRPQGTAAELERRRRLAIHLMQQGHTQAQAARIVRANRSSVNRWWKAYRRKGPKALNATPPTGPPSKLTARQKRGLLRRLQRGAKNNGFSTDLWTCPRIAQLIRKHYGVRYHVDSLPRFLRSLGLTPQKPAKRAIERDEKAIQTWVDHDWPRIKKSRS